jgi:hypothetical protein
MTVRAAIPRKCPGAIAICLFKELVSFSTRVVTVLGTWILDVNIETKAAKEVVGPKRLEYPQASTNSYYCPGDKRLRYRQIWYV